MLCGFGMLKMRTKVGLMRKREEREGLSHLVGPTSSKVSTELPLESIFYFFKIGLK